MTQQTVSESTMNYRELTRFQINKLVAIRLGMNADKSAISPSVLSNGYNDRYPHTVWACKSGEPWEQFCFTNNREDWATLVEDFSINLSFDTCQVHASSYFSDTGRVSYSRRDIGLAVCIAFLEMKDWQKANQDQE